MDDQQLKKLIREQYPFPIAHAHKKMLGVLDENVEKLKCILETAEATIQFLGLLVLAQVRQDLLNPPLTPPRREIVPDFSKLREEIALAAPSFGKWNRLTREIMKAYSDAQDSLVVPELFDVFWMWNTSGQRLCIQPLDNKVIEPLITLRNDFHHGRVPDSKVREKVTEGLHWLHQFLEALQFLAQYELSFIQRILVAQRDSSYVHDLTLFTGCLYEPERRTYAMQMDPGSLIFLHKQDGRHLRLEPFLIYTDHRKGPDILLLNNMAKKKASYVSSQFAGEELRTNDQEWQEGSSHYKALSEFLEQLQSPELSEEEISPESVDILPAPETTKEEEESLLSTAEVFQQKYQVKKPVIQHTSPYKFLDYYNPEDHDIFFGRDKEVRLLEQKFHNTRLLVLHGESGTGKTSLIRAGLIPQLDPESYIPVYVRVLQEALREIKRELLHQLGLEQPCEGSETFARLAELLKQVSERVSKTVIIVLDQFEEFFLRFPEEVRQQFKKEFAECVATPRLDVKFLLSLRADYFSYLATFEDAIPQIFTHQIQLERLSELQALEAVIRPAERLGIEVDEPMVQIKLLPELIAEEGGIEPPLLQIVCDALYQNAQSEGRQEICMADYEAVGDVKGALGKYLENKLRQFGKNQRVAKIVLKALVTVEGTKRASFLAELVSRVESMGVNLVEDADRMPALPGEPTPRPSQEGNIRAEVLKKKYLDKFVRDRLVRVEDVEGEARYELSHEYLVKHIGAWIEESERELTKVLELIDRAYEAYQATGLLLESSALQMIKPFKDQLILPAEKQTFVDRSKILVRKKRRGLLLKVGALLLLVIVVLGGIFGYQKYQDYQQLKYQKQRAEEQRQKAEEQTKIAKENLKKAGINAIEALNQTSKALFATYDELGALVTGVKAVKQAKQANVPETLNNRTLVNLEKLLSGIHEQNRLIAHKTPVMSVVFSPDGTSLASGSQDGIIKLWRVADGREIRTLHGHTDSVLSMIFSPDGVRLASGSADKTIKLWHIADGREIRTLHGHADSVRSVTFSPDGTLLASGSKDKTIRLWSIEDGRELRTVKQDSSDYDCEVLSVNFSQHDRLFAFRSCTLDYYFHLGIQLWKVADDRKITLVADYAPSIWWVEEDASGHSDEILCAAVSPDSSMLFVSGSRDKTIKFWEEYPGYYDTAFGATFTLPGHSASVHSITFSPDSRLLASGSADKTVKLWDIADGEELKTLHGHAAPIENLAFSPDGTLLASGSWDQTVKLWNLEDKTIKLWNPDSDDLVIYGCEWLRGYLKTHPDISEIDRLVCLDEEIAAYQKQIEDNPAHETAWNNMGLALYKQGKPEEALTAFRKQVEVKPDHQDAWYQIGHILQAQGKPDEALTAFRKQVEVKPDHQDAWYPIGNILHDQGKPDEAIAAFQKHGKVMQQQGKLDDAIALYRQVLEMNPEHRAALYDMGNALQQYDKLSEAIPVYQKLLEIQPEHENAWNKMGLAFNQQGKPEKAIAAFQQQLKINPEHEQALRNLEIIGNKLQHQNQLDKAIAVYQKLLEIKPDHKWVWNTMGLAFNQQGKPEEAIAAFQRQIEINPEHESALKNIKSTGDELKKQDKLDEAITVYQKLLEIKSDHESAWNSIGLALREQGKLEEAIAAYQKQVEITPDHKYAWGNMGYALQKQGKPDEAIAAYQKQAEVLEAQGESDKAIAAYQKLLKIRPEHETALHNMGNALQKRNKLNEAIAAYQKLLDINPGHDSAWNNLGSALRRKGKPEEAITALNKQLELKPEHEEAWHNMGLVFKKQGKLDEALAAFQRQIEINPEHESALKNIKSIGDELKKQDKLDEAITVYQKLLEIKPDHESAWNSIGLVLRKQGKLEEAITAYRKQLEIKPDHKTAWYNMGYALRKQGTLGEAIDAFQKQLAVRPNYKKARDAIQNIGKDFERQGKLDKAITIYQNLLAMKPDDEDLRNKIGVVLYKQGKLDEAIAAYQKQLEVNPDHRLAWRHMGSALWEQGKVKEATKAWDKAATIFARKLIGQPNDPILLAGDAILALLQDDISRCQSRIAAALPQVPHNDQKFAIFLFLAWLAAPEQGWEPVMTAISELDPKLPFTWNLSDLTPVIERQEPENQQIARHFSVFFEGEIDLPTLKARLLEKDFDSGR